MTKPVGINIWSRLVEQTFPYLDQVVAPFDSIWFPDHVQYGDAKVAEGWSLLAYALARYPDKLCGHDVLCNSFRNPAHLAKMAATMQVISEGRVVIGIGAGWNEEEYNAYGWPFPNAKTRISQLAEAVQILRKLWVLPVDIRLSAHTNRLKFRPRSYSYVGQVPMLDVFDKPLADWDAFVKATFDRVVAALVLVLASPVMFAVAAAVKLESKGPVFFKQKRYGFNNELIEVYKFRSMYTDKADANASRLVTKDDPRVTRVGRFIRKTSLDELPQLFNVLRGELSLVGPRPHALQAKAAERLYDDVVDGYFARHKVKPGISGWAQINGWRGETDTQEKIQRRVEHDLYYIENWSIWFDIYILAMTPISLMDTRSAY